MPRVPSCFLYSPQISGAHVYFPCDVFITMTNTLMNLFFFRIVGVVVGGMVKCFWRNTWKQIYANECTSPKGMPFSQQCKLFFGIQFQCQFINYIKKKKKKSLLYIVHYLKTNKQTWLPSLMSHLVLAGFTM